MDEKLINWTYAALEMLAEVHAYIAESSESRADKYVNDLYNSTEKLKKYPEFYPPCRNPKLQTAGFRCAIFKKHIIIYEVTEDAVNILAVMHAKRNPTDFEELVS